MATIHNISEYAFAVEVVAKFPQIQRDINELYKKLQPNAGFLAVSNVLESIHNSNELLTIQFKYYKMVLDKKGSK